MTDLPSLTCHKCGTTYSGDLCRFFYWRPSRQSWQRPCKSCIANYNKTENQKLARRNATQRYEQTEKGKAARQRAVETQLIKRSCDV